MNRRTGRMFRMLLKAAYHASNGENVLVVAYTTMYAKRLTDVSSEICRDYSKRSSPTKIEFESGGQINFVSRTYYKKWLRTGYDPRLGSIFYDHFQGGES